MTKSKLQEIVNSIVDDALIALKLEHPEFAKKIVIDNPIPPKPWWCPSFIFIRAVKKEVYKNIDRIQKEILIIKDNQKDE